MTKGARAMAVAMMYPEPEKGGRGKKSEARNMQETCGFSRTLLDQARAVLDHSKLLADAVLAGLKTAKRRLADEYDAAQERGEVAKDGQRRKAVPDENSISTAAEIGLSRKEIHESRLIRDAELFAQCANIQPGRNR